MTQDELGVVDATIGGGDLTQGVAGQFGQLHALWLAYCNDLAVVVAVEPDLVGLWP